MANGEVTELAKEIDTFYDDWMYYYTPGQGIGKPVHVPWETFEKMVKLARHYLASRPAAEVPITPKLLEDCGFRCVGDSWLHYGEDLRVQRGNFGGEWHLSWSNTSGKYDYWPKVLKNTNDIIPLLTALGIEATR